MFHVELLKGGCLDMKLLKNMLFNTNVKIAGNIVTVKTYQDDQLYNYVAKRYQTGFEKK